MDERLTQTEVLDCGQTEAEHAITIGLLEGPLNAKRCALVCKICSDECGTSGPLMILWQAHNALLIASTTKPLVEEGGKATVIETLKIMLDCTHEGNLNANQVQGLCVLYCLCADAIDDKVATDLLRVLLHVMQKTVPNASVAITETMEHILCAIYSRTMSESKGHDVLSVLMSLVLQDEYTHWEQSRGIELATSVVIAAAKTFTEDPKTMFHGVDLMCELCSALALVYTDPHDCAMQIIRADQTLVPCFNQLICCWVMANKNHDSQPDSRVVLRFAEVIHTVYTATLYLSNSDSKSAHSILVSLYLLLGHMHSTMPKALDQPQTLALLLRVVFTLTNLAFGRQCASTLCDALRELALQLVEIARVHFPEKIRDVISTIMIDTAGVEKPAQGAQDAPSSSTSTAKPTPLQRRGVVSGPWTVEPLSVLLDLIIHTPPPENAANTMSPEGVLANVAQIFRPPDVWLAQALCNATHPNDDVGPITTVAHVLLDIVFRNTQSDTNICFATMFAPRSSSHTTGASRDDPETSLLDFFTATIGGWFGQVTGLDTDDATPEDPIWGPPCAGIQVDPNATPSHVHAITDTVSALEETFECPRVIKTGLSLLDKWLDVWRVHKCGECTGKHALLAQYDPEEFVLEHPQEHRYQTMGTVSSYVQLCKKHPHLRKELLTEITAMTKGPGSCGEDAVSMLSILLHILMVPLAAGGDECNDEAIDKVAAMIRGLEMPRSGNQDTVYKLGALFIAHGALDRREKLIPSMVLCALQCLDAVRQDSSVSQMPSHIAAELLAYLVHIAPHTTPSNVARMATCILLNSNGAHNLEEIASKVGVILGNTTSRSDMLAVMSGLVVCTHKSDHDVDYKAFFDVTRQLAPFIFHSDGLAPIANANDIASTLALSLLFEVELQRRGGYGDQLRDSFSNSITRRVTALSSAMDSKTPLVFPQESVFILQAADRIAGEPATTRMRTPTPMQLNAIHTTCDILTTNYTNATSAPRLDTLLTNVMNCFGKTRQQPTTTATAAETPTATPGSDTSV